MALISQQVQELQTILKRMDAGTITNEEVTARCKVHSLIHKQEKAALQVMALSLMNGMTPKKLSAAGLMSKNEIINISIPELSEELVLCPDTDENMSRADCLDYSGESKNSKSCQSCTNFRTTRKMLMAEA